MRPQHGDDLASNQSVRTDCGRRVAPQPPRFCGTHEQAVAKACAKRRERLLGDAIRGEARLFVREGAAEAAWRVVDSVIGNATPVHEYEPNTLGHPRPNQIAAKRSG
jgi:glucose-6-phosphate 1-dehydrogenase